MIQRFCHLLLKFMTQKKSREFYDSCKNLKETQLKKMLEITGVKSYEDFTNNYSLSKYGDYKVEIEHRKISDKTIQFVPTSGSSEIIKWIPYTKKLKEELFNASSVWLNDLYSRHEGIDQGLHYWSMSWLPEELRTTHHVNDLNFFGGIERFILSQTLAQKKELLSLKSIHESMLETLIMILNNKVTVLSVWSPTFLIEILNLFLSEKKNDSTKAKR